MTRVSFLHLPTEIRSSIYHFVFVSQEVKPITYAAILSLRDASSDDIVGDHPLLRPFLPENGPYDQLAIDGIQAYFSYFTWQINLAVSKEVIDQLRVINDQSIRLSQIRHSIKHLIITVRFLYFANRTVWDVVDQLAQFPELLSLRYNLSGNWHVPEGSDALSFHKGTKGYLHREYLQIFKEEVDKKSQQHEEANPKNRCSIEIMVRMDGGKMVNVEDLLGETGDYIPVERIYDVE